MSLLRFIKLPDVKKKLAAVRPKMSRKIGVPVRVRPRSKRQPLVGQAFDYLVRFELQRLAPYAVSGPWVVEKAPEIFLARIVLVTDPEDVARRASQVIADAKAAVAEYIKAATVD